MTLDWATNTGPTNRIFNNDEIANALRNSPAVNEARRRYYEKYKNQADLTNTAYQGFNGKFGASGYINSGANPVEQFVGGDRISISSIDGQTLIFFITNRTSMESFLFDQGPSYDRPSIFPGANTYQTYIFTEPIIRK